MHEVATPSTLVSHPLGWDWDARRLQNGSCRISCHGGDNFCILTKSRFVAKVVTKALRLQRPTFLF